MAERGELTLEQTAERLKVSRMTVLRLIGGGALKAWQVCKGAPWAIAEAPSCPGWMSAAAVSPPGTRQSGSADP